MDISLFKYDETKHLGYYNGKLIPSTTQLLDIIYPLDSDIPQDRLDKASERGTEIHKLIEELNKYFDDPLPYNVLLDENIDIAIEMKEDTGKQEIIDYVSILSAYKLKPYDYEQVVFLLDENEEPICYGHYDSTMLATETNELVEENNLYLVDFKTTSLFDKKKTNLQTSIYSVAYEQNKGETIKGTFGIWLREGVKIIPLELKDKVYVIKLCKELRKIYDERNIEKQVG